MGFLLLLIAFISSVDYYEKLLVKDGICYRIIFCDFSGQARLRPVLSAYLEAVNGVVFVVDGSNPQGLENILIFTELFLISLWFPSQRPWNVLYSGTSESKEERYSGASDSQ